MSNTIPVKNNENQKEGNPLNADQPASRGEPTAEKDVPASKMKERVISERVVSERVIGSSSKVARFGRKVKGKISSRLGGIGLGIILILVSFIVVWQSENIDRSSEIVKDLPLLTVEQAADSKGMVKV